MKVRSGFVANSSSSSFICGICDSLEIYGMDQDWEGVKECYKCGHAFHEACLEKLFPDEKDLYMTGKYGDKIIKEEMCPVCNGSKLTDSMRKMWIEMYGDSMETEYKRLFKSYAEFAEEYNRIIKQRKEEKKDENQK
jgi:hypothetical protein